MPRIGHRLAMAGATLVAAGLAIYPIHRAYLGLELQEHFPRNAVMAFTDGTWRPFGLHHGAAFFDALRVLYTLWFAIGRAIGAYEDRTDLLAAFVRDPFPFVVVGRVLVLACAGIALVMVAKLAHATADRTAGPAAVLFAGVTFVWVRGVHHVWLDVPSAAVALATIMACLRAAATGRLPAALVAGALAGLTIATKHSSVPIVVPVALAVVIAPARAGSVRLGRLVASAAATVTTFLALSPYAIIEFSETIELLRILNRVLSGESPGALPFSTASRLCLGLVLPSLAAVGLVAGLRHRPVTTTLVAAYPVVHLLILLSTPMLYVRYLVPLAPFVAIFAAAGARVLGRVVLPRSPGIGLTVVAMTAAASPALQSFAYVRFLARSDTRQLAGDWIRHHVAPGTPITLPNVVRYPNPVLPWSAAALAIHYREHSAALMERVLDDGSPSYPTTYLGMFGTFRKDWTPGSGIVVEAYHPAIVQGMNLPTWMVTALHAAHARPVATFQGTPVPLPDGVVYDNLDADYVPLTGFDRLERPGPNITIWQLPTDADSNSGAR